MNKTEIEKELELALAREKELLEKVSVLELAKNKGDEKLKTTIKNMLMTTNMFNFQISDLTGASEPEIEKLKEEAEQGLTKEEIERNRSAAIARALSREMAIRDELSWKARIKEAVEEGKEEGRQKSLIKIAKNLLAGSNMSISEIAKVTKLSEEKVQTLKEELQ